MSNGREVEITVTENKPSPARKVLKSSGDVNVATVVLYANESNELFYDPEFKEAVPKEDGTYLFVMRAVAKKGDVCYAPTSCAADGTITFPFPA